MCEYEKQILEAFVAASRLSAKFDCPVDRQNVLLLASAHACETFFFLCVLNSEWRREGSLLLPEQENAMCTNDKDKSQ